MNPSGRIDQFVCWCVLVCLFFLWPSAAECRNIVRGGIALEQGYDSNIDRVPENEISEWTTTLRPSIEYTHAARRSEFLLRYAPGLVYSCLTDDTRWEHSAFTEYKHNLTRNLLVSLSDRFLRTEDPYEETADVEDGIVITDRRGRRRYWVNSASVRAEYTYGQGSTAEAGYSYQVLENEDEIVQGELSDYVKHKPTASILHRINYQWDVGLDYAYVNGDFDEDTEDFAEHREDLYLYYHATRFTTLFGHFGYINRNYDITLEDYSVYTGATGLEHQYSSTLFVKMEVGASLVNRENFEDTEAVFLRAAIDKSWQRSTWTLEAESGLDNRDFAGINELGLSRYWLVNTNVTRTLLRNVTGRVGASYREDTFIEAEPEADEQTVKATAELAWSFARWYEFSTRYIFIDNNADFEHRSYTDHRFDVTFSAEKDLFQW